MRAVVLCVVADASEGSQTLQHQQIRGRAQETLFSFQNVFRR